MQRFLLPVAAGLIVMVAILAGLSAYQAVRGGTSADLDDVEAVVRFLQDNYVDRTKVSNDQLQRAAIRGLVSYLDDPYTWYLSPEQYQDYNAFLQGEHGDFGGIGAEVTLRDGQLIILAAYPDSPAARSGIQPGDIVLEVNGEDIGGLSLAEATALIRGPKGTEVRLRILRIGDLTPFDVTIVRDTIALRSVSGIMLEPGIAYIGIDVFDANTASVLRETIRSLRDQGMQGLVLDLRNNTGGLLDSAVDVASEFIKDGVILVWKEADSEREIRTTGGGTAYDVPMVVLVNGFSASGSEIVAGALQDHQRATLVGTRTFGKGSGGLFTSLPSGAGLNYTVARWLTPNGRLIEGEGLDPDVHAGPDLSLQSAQRIGHLTESLCSAFNEERDGLADYAELADAVDALCNLEASTAPPIAGTPDQLDVAVELLKEKIGNS